MTFEQLIEAKHVGNEPEINIDLFDKSIPTYKSITLKLI